MKHFFYGTISALIAFVAMVLVPTTVIAEQGELLVRARGIYVSPVESTVTSVIGGGIDVSNVVTPELDFTYFFTDNVATELILATSRHQVTATGTTLGDVDLGKVSLLPPILLLQYHVTGMEGFKPYVGAGINLTIFYSENVATGSAVTSIDYKTRFGFALQAGVDVPLGNDGWFLNADIKKLYLSTDVALNDGTINAAVKINPWIFGLGFGRSF
jgi:outer membrane protein